MIGIGEERRQAIGGPPNDEDDAKPINELVQEIYRQIWRKKNH